MLTKKTKNMTDSERIAVDNSNNQYLKTLTYAPVGMIVPFLGGVEPSCFLVCDGSTLDTTEYTDLFNAIGYTYGGSGDVFKIPNLSGATISGISVRYIIKTANGVTQQEVNEIVVNAVPKIAIDSNIGFMDAVICVKEGAMFNENGIPHDSDYVYKTIDTGSYAGKNEMLPGGIAARDDNGNLWSGEPIADVDCANKKYVDNLAGVHYVMKDSDSEVSLNSPAGNSYVQVNDKGNVVIHSEYEVSFEGSRLMDICDPHEDTDAANKGYVDSTAKLTVPRVSESNQDAAKALIIKQNAKLQEIGGKLYPDDSDYQHLEIDQIYNKFSPKSKVLVVRDAKGNLYTGTPTDDQDCVPYSMYKELLERVEALEQKI